MSSSEQVTKRLHVSGLTPQISADDLRRRFSSFGNVKALDGLGNLDALGQPRPFAYVTIETTKAQLAKCLNLLSGTTWKGAKLRIGGAKPDFRERIRKENEAASENDVRPAKRRRLARGTQGVHASDMSLVSPSSLRPGWRVTPLGRLVRPMRLRPLRPVTPGVQKLATLKKKRKEKKTLLVRARRRLIDPEDWGSSYLSGMMLEGGSGVVLPERPAKTREVRVSEREADVEETPTQIVDTSDAKRWQLPSSPPLSSLPPVTVPPVVATTDKNPHMGKPEPETDLAQEAAQSLALLSSLFGSGRTGQLNTGDDDWGNAESLSDLDMDAEHLSVPPTTLESENDGIEFFPRERSSKPAKAKVSQARTPEEEFTEVPTIVVSDKELTEPQPQTKVQMTKLKDMFAPRPEDAGFSILGNLDLDLELDEEFLPIPSVPLQIPEPDSGQPTFISTFRQSTFTFDPTRPFFFPHVLTFQASVKIKPGDPHDIFSKPLDFLRTETSDEIHARWEARKVELTRDWKRRHREAVKSARRRGGVQD